ncbi:hypothetical protein SVIOM342S_00107 [Streptomyces violaceorubidus]
MTGILSLPTVASKPLPHTHLVVLPGAAREPEGDVVMCDVAREAGDELINGLRALGIDSCGAITAENIDLSLSDRADQAERDAPGEAADAALGSNWRRRRTRSRRSPSPTSPSSRWPR